LEKTQSYFIKLEWKTLMVTNNRLRNNYQVPTEFLKPQEVDAPFKNLNPELKTFCNSGIRNLKIESQLNANYSFDNFQKEIPID
jgi:hypothetical protein